MITKFNDKESHQRLHFLLLIMTSGNIDENILKERSNLSKIQPLDFKKKMIAQLQKMFSKIPMKTRATISLLCYFANLFPQKYCLISRSD